MLVCLQVCKDILFRDIFNYFVSDYSKGFGGKYGVQTDRKDQVRFNLIYNNTVSSLIM